MKMTDSPGAMLVTPVRAMALAKALELSSTFQPVISTVLALMLVTSNQSPPTAPLPLDQGATSVTISAGGAGVSTSWSRMSSV